MSSEYLEDVEYAGAVVFLTMRANGFARLTILEPDAGSDVGAVAGFQLLPDKVGLENAQKIATALGAWSDHIKTVGLLQ